MSDDPRSAEPVPAPPYEDEPSTTGVVAEGAEGADGGGDSSPSTAATDQQSALEEAVENQDPDGSAAAGA